MPEFSSSPEAKVLSRLAQLHRTEQAPAAARARFAGRLAELEAAPPAPRRSRWALRAGAGLTLLAAAAALLVWSLREREYVTPSREQPHAAAQVSLSGVAVPGSLRWRSSGSDQDRVPRECLYRFSLLPAGSPPIEVHWKQCQFPQQLLELTGRRSSPPTGELRVQVSGHWLEPGQLEATELRILP